MKLRKSRSYLVHSYFLRKAKLILYLNFIKIDWVLPKEAFILDQNGKNKDQKQKHEQDKLVANEQAQEDQNFELFGIS